MKKLWYVLLALIVAAGVGAVASADGVDKWRINIGIGGNTYGGGGNDFGAPFGAMTNALDGFDSKDAVHPAPMDPEHDLTWSYQDYLTDGGRGYPQPWGLLKDIKEPYSYGFKVWEVIVYAPNPDETFYVSWCVGINRYRLPDPWIAKLDMDGSSGGSHDLDEYELDLLENYTGGYECFRYPPDPYTLDQFGYGNEQDWYLIAGIPEPQVAQLAGFILGIAGLGFVRLSKR